MTDFYVVGVNHKTSNLALREQIAFVAAECQEALQDCQFRSHLPEVLLLSTCNRTELLFWGDGDAPQRVAAWLAQYHRVDQEALGPVLYSHAGDAALRHVMRVACGLDSMILGEPQILGQLKKAYQQAREAGTSGVHLERLLHTVFAAAKQVRTDTDIAVGPVTVAYSIVHLARRIFSDLSQCRVLCLGAGEVASLVCEHLQAQGVTHFVVASRSRASANGLAQQLRQADAVTMGEVPQQLVAADLIVAATATQLPVLGKGAVERVAKQRARRPLFIADLAVPRDVEPEVGELADVYLYNIDDLQSTIATNKNHREQAAQQAESLITRRVQQWQQEMAAAEAMAVVKDFRRQLEQLRDHEIQQGLQELSAGKSAEVVLVRRLRQLVNRMLHQPTMCLRQAAKQGDWETLALAKQLFYLQAQDALESEMSDESTTVDN